MTKTEKKKKNCDASGNKIKDKGVSFCFTDYSKANLANGYKKIFEEYKDIIRGLAWSKETCPKTKNIHNQAYIQMYSQSRWGFIQKIIKSSCHFEVMYGSIPQNETYCSKEARLTKLGYFCSRGYRTDMHNIKDDMHDGASMYQIMDKYTGTYCRASNHLEKMKGLIDKHRRNEMGFRAPEVTVLCGPAGDGKTDFVYKKEGYHNCFKVSRYDDPKFMFNGYGGEDVILFDDFNGSIRYSYFLQILDGYPMDMNIKNGIAYNFFSKVYITSNNKPCKWYSKIGDNLKRRINSCLEVAKGNTRVLSQPWEDDDSETEYAVELDNIIV